MTVSPIQAPSIYDTVVIAGLVSPGLCKISGVSRKFKMDKKEGKGASGGTSTYVGKVIPEFKIAFRMWEQQHFDQWEPLESVLLKANDGDGTALDISHPDLERVGIFHVMVEDVGVPEQVREGDSEYVVTIALSEYHPPKKAGGTASKSKGGAGAAPLPEPGVSDEEWAAIQNENAGETDDERDLRELEEEAAGL